MISAVPAVIALTWGVLAGLAFVCLLILAVPERFDETIGRLLGDRDPPAE